MPRDTPFPHCAALHAGYCTVFLMRAWPGY
jgi:hypothetical protein